MASEYYLSQSNDFFAHSAKGSTWNNHKYSDIQIINGKKVYVYGSGGGTSNRLQALYSRLAKKASEKTKNNSKSIESKIKAGKSGSGSKSKATKEKAAKEPKEKKETQAKEPKEKEEKKEKVKQVAKKENLRDPRVLMQRINQMRLKDIDEKITNKEAELKLRDATKEDKEEMNELKKNLKKIWRIRNG